MATIRSLTAAIRVDGSGMQADLAKSTERVRAWQSDIRRLNAEARRADKAGDASAAARSRQIAAGLAERQAALQEQTAARAALQQRLADRKAAAAEEAAIRRDLEDKHLAATSGRQALELAQLDRHYATLREKHKANAKLVEQIDRTHAAERAKIQQQTAAGRGGGALGTLQRAVQAGIVIQGAAGLGQLGTGIVAAWRGDSEKLLESIQRMPFGLGTAALAIADFYRYATGQAGQHQKEMERMSRSIERINARNTSIRSLGEIEQAAKDRQRSGGLSGVGLARDQEDARFRAEQARIDEQARTLGQKHSAVLAARREAEAAHNDELARLAEQAAQQRQQIRDGEAGAAAAEQQRLFDDDQRDQERQIRQARELRDARIEADQEGAKRQLALLDSRHAEERKLAGLHGEDLQHLARRQAIQREAAVREVEMESARESIARADAEMDATLARIDKIAGEKGPAAAGGGPGQFSTAYGSRVNLASLAGRFGEDPATRLAGQQKELQQQMVLLLQQMVAGMLA